MRQHDIIQQIDGWRYTYACPRGIVAIDERMDGTREIICALGGHPTRRDIRDAQRLHERLLADSAE